MLVQLSRPKDPAREEAERKKLERELLRETGRAIQEHDLVGEGDRILVAISGGKDSYAMMKVLSLLQKRAPVRFELVAVNIDQGFRGFRADVVEDWLKENRFEYHIEASEFDEIIQKHVEPGGTACSLCARLRRGVLYRLADELKCNKVALGHHMDDVIETLMLNLFFNGVLKAMPLKLVSNDGRHTVIRPLGYCREERIRRYGQLEQFPVISCACKHCGDTSMQRQQVKAMLREMERKSPGLKKSMLTAISTVKPRHLLDRDLMRRVSAGGANPEAALSSMHRAIAADDADA